MKRRTLAAIMSAWVVAGPVAAQAPQPSTTSEASLATVLAAALAPARTQPLAAALDVRQQASLESELAAARGPWRLELGGEAGSDHESERRFGVKLGKSFHLGRDEDALRRQLAAERDADLASAEAQRMETAREAGRAYAALLHYRRVATAVETLRREARPFDERMAAAGSGGSVGALTAMKWRLLSGKMQARQESAASAFKRTATQLNTAFALSLPIDPSSARLAAIAPAASKGNAPAQPELRAALATEAALQAKARVAADAYELEGAVGAERVMAHDKDPSVAVLVSVGIPLGQGAVRRSHAAAVEADRAVAAARGEALKDTLAIRAGALAAELDAARTQAAELDRQRAAVRSLYEQARKAFQNGHAAFDEVMEATAMLYELELEASDAARDAESLQVDLILLTGGAA